MSAPGRVLAGVVAVAATFALVVASGVEWAASADDAARLRLSWRTVGERIEACRPPTPEELAGLPPHMRPREICDGRLLPYRLRIRVDDEARVDRIVRPAGAREDRPTYVFEELRLAPGPRHIEVSFTVERPGDARGGVPSRDLRLDARVEVAPREVVLVTDRDGLVIAEPLD